MTRHIVLAGGGHAHLAMLADWARRPLPDTARTLITPSRHAAYSGMLPGWMAGLYSAEDMQIDLAPLAERAGAKLVLAEVAGLDAVHQILRLSDGGTIRFDLLSLAIGGQSDLAALAGVGERLLPVRPIGAFMARWSQSVAGLRAGSKPHIAVVGGGAGGVELALAICAALRPICPAARVELVAGPEGLLPGHAPRVRALVGKALAARGVTVHAGLAQGLPEGLALPDGTVLPADLVIAATGSAPPRWLAQSGLACTERGFVAVGADLRSASHPAIFAAGDITARTDRTLARSGVHAVKAGPVLAANLRAALKGAPLRDYQPGARTLYLLAQGDRRAIASWGGLAASGKLAWWLKDHIDRRFIARYTGTATTQGSRR